MRNIFKQILFAILLLLIQLPSFAEEVTELYLVRNSHLKDVKDISDFYSRQKNLIVKSQDSYSVSYITDREYFVAYFEQAGKDVYFYYYSPSENKYSYKDIVSRLKNKNYSCKREKNKPTKQIFYNKVMSIAETSKLSEQKKQEEAIKTVLLFYSLIQC